MRLISRLALSWLLNAVVLGVVALVLSDVDYERGRDLVAAAAVFGVLNTILKPIMRFFTVILAVLTLGLAWFFVSMLMLWLTDVIVPGFDIRGFWTLVWATIIAWLVNLVVDLLVLPWRNAGAEPPPDPYPA